MAAPIVEKTPPSCVELLAAMVGFDTVNGRISGRSAAEGQMGAWLDTVAAAWGFATQRLTVRDDAFNLIVTHVADVDAPWLLFESHMDTVTADGMTIDPFAGEVRDGRVWGRGACDTKGSGAAMLWALRQYADGDRQPNNIAVAYTTDEEFGKDGAKKLVEEHLSHVGWKPVGAIVGEPTLLKPVIAHNGGFRWKIKTRGIAAHSCDPSQGRSAISKMVGVIDALESRYIPSVKVSHPLVGPAACSINLIQGGKQINVIPDQCEISIDRRLSPGENRHAIQPEVEKLLDELRGADSELQVTQGEPFFDPPLDPAPNESLCKFVQKVLADMGLPTDACGVQYGTDASQFTEIAVPAVVIGPGSIDQAHTKDEWLELAQLDRCVELYLNLMREPARSG